MKKLIIALLFVIILGGCNMFDDRNEIDKNDFDLINHDVNDYDINTYYLDVVLDEENDKLYVTGEIIYINDKTDFNELYITLYPNADEFVSLDNVDIDYIKINGLEVEYEVVGYDYTQIHIDLEYTLEKDDNFSIEFKYNFEYWDYGRLMALGDYYLTMFFYPFLSMYDDEGWNIDPFTFHGESYYNDIGDYYVTLNVRDDFLVATSGKLLFEDNEDGRLIKYLYLEDGRDFSFSASPNYFYYEEVINERLFKIYSVRELENYEADNSFKYMEDTFNLFEEYVGEYYYDYFTLEYGYYYGMESSGVVYCSADISEGTVVHEVIHQWFYSMIGNDQSDESFLDESLTTFVSGIYFLDVYGIEGANDYYGYRTSLSERFEERYQLVLGDSLLRKVDEFEDQYGYLIYYHGVSIFKYYVDEYLGGDYYYFLELLSHYYDEYNGDTASIEEFLVLLERESGVDITKEWFELQIGEVQDLSNTP